MTATVGNCTDCQRPMTPTHIKAANRPPGMVRHTGKGICDGCRSTRNREARRLAATQNAVQALYQRPDTDWMDDGACQNTGYPDLWYPDNGQNPNAAKTICNGDKNHGRPPCPVRDQCLAHALATAEPHGVWGGLSRKERAELLRRGRQQAAS